MTDNKEWYLNGAVYPYEKAGPAVEPSEGHKEWYLNGVAYPYEKAGPAVEDK
jgi:hypothetical protein